MKKLIYPFLVASFVTLSMVVFADPPNPPPPPSNPQDGSGGDPVGAPIDSGLSVLLILGAAYGAKKIIDARKAKEEEKAIES